MTEFVIQLLTLVSGLKPTFITRSLTASSPYKWASLIILEPVELIDKLVMEIEQEVESADHGNYGKKYIEYSCSCRYLFDRRRIILQYVCLEHDLSNLPC